MSYFTDKAEAARLDRESKAEQARLDRIAEQEHALKLATLAHEHAKQDRADAKATADERRTDRRATWAKVRAWVTGHVVDLLIYPLMLGSAAVAIPTAAAWGAAHLGEAGGILPVLSEWGMVAFSIAVHYTRVKHPARPVWALQLGTWVFAAIGFAIAVIRGATSTGPGSGFGLGVVMGLVSIAGVAAHQLVSAAPRRSAAERAAARLAKQEAAEVAAELATRKVAAARIDAARRAAIAHAVAEIDPDGTARLVYRPGRYELRRRRLAPGRLTPASVMGLPVTPADDEDGGAGVADEAAAYLAGLRFRRLTDTAPDTGTTPPPPAGGTGGSGVATVDPAPPHPSGPVADAAGTPADKPGPVRESGRTVPTRRTSPGRRAARSVIPEPKRRSFEELTTEFDALVADPPAGFDPTNGESIRLTLKCAKTNATKLKRRYLDRASTDTTDAARRPGGSD
ncbi:hypothetical protein [Amycolatopsis sp. CA-128772]|uniref:hypothetical protein n=1 Tax=Amycolatopsis sp. CA-128772 TaxID=2073159 RepID=UPI001E5A7E77|nr:hypothetical protein [Amycolatopsis sp. CA-128772]